ncbi:Putative histone-lysine N-methyltransferase, H3 lysine-9 specific SUVH9 [Glycine soja]|uniref:Putative histone-lysine N-methyltransferase, H3 lysine-9 specific SUVH9 n=1 Tax=Glycine soja TaxID=3848 RepID=A0A0B2NPN5_GLYSO|nr:Putative histone-lysine N-methyltransferase, H3 lysine-9 specific SUVH9 [Glycine soja]
MNSLFSPENLPPPPGIPIPATIAAASTTTPNPILIPKLEPFDEWLNTHTPQQQQQSQDPNSSNGSLDLDLKLFGDETPEDFSGDPNLLSDFNRLSQLFRTAFSNNNAVPDPITQGIQQLGNDAVSNPFAKPPQNETTIDLRASAVMRNCGLWLNRDKRIVGAIPGVCIGDVFLYRMELCVVGLHGQPQAGIDYLPASMSSNGEPIATSVIVSGGYEDDVDEGDVIIYSGHGGQDKHSRQVFHQKLEGGNLAMERSMHYGIEVRVIRGVRYEGAASATGRLYVYDGLYRIHECWFDVGKSGFGVYKYKLCRIDGQAKMGTVVMKEALMLRKDPLSFKPMCCLSLDVSNRKENVAIRLFNDIDRNYDPLQYEYLVKTNFPQFVFHQSGRGTGCECVDGCVEGCFCAMKNGGDFPYNQSGILLRGKPLVFECGPFCHCPPHCRNRVTQKGLKNRLEVFRSRETGWGVRSLDLIQAGAFICEYTGVVLTRDQAQLLTMNGDSLIYPNRFTDRWAEWGDLSMIDSNYVRPSYPSIPPLDFAMDVSRMRNVACYMSHSSTPNVLVQFVLYDHNNLMFPHLMLFAMESIPPMRELSLDYGVADEWTGKLSIGN